MSVRRADLNLLMGLIAWQTELITKDQLLDALQEWTQNKDHSVSEILRRRQFISDADKSRLESEAHRRGDDDTVDVTNSLPPDAGVDQLRSDLTRLGDPELLESLDTTHAVDAGDLIGGLRFIRIRQHAKGGLGVVWLAKDRELSRDVALKEIREDHVHNPLDRKRFVLEAEITGGLEHPNIVPVYGMGKHDDGRPYYAMRFVRGTSLRDAIDEFHHRNPRKLFGNSSGEIELRRLLARFIDVCHAIAYAHSRSVLHRDLKPDNIMLGKFGETLVVDWGLADPMGYRKKMDQVVDQSSGSELELPLKPSSGSIPTSQGQPLGTIGFMSPEQARGDIDLLGVATDVYSLGATLYQLLTGTVPIRSKHLGEALDKIAAGNFPRPSELKSDVPKALEAICLKAMALAPDQRYVAANLLAEDIENWMADDPVAALPDTRWESGQRWLRKNRTWAQAGAASLIVILIAITTSAVRISSYRKTQLAASQMSELNALFDRAVLQPNFSQPDNLRELKKFLDQLAQLGATNTNDKYSNLVAVFDRHLGNLRADRKFNAERKADYDRQIGNFKESFGQQAESQCDEWFSAGQTRFADWYTVFDAPDQDRFASLSLDAAEIAVAQEPELAGNSDGPANTLLRRADAANNFVNHVAIAPIKAADVRWRVGFDHTWCNSSVIGLNVMYEAANSSARSSEYSFILASMQANSSVIENGDFGKLSPISAKVVDQFSMEVQMMILRNGSQLRRKVIRLSRAPVQLECKRQGSRLEFSISSAESSDSHSLEIDDPFALPQRPGTVGVVWPASIVVQSMKLEQMSTPLTPNPLEEADEHYNQGRFLEALALYDALPATPEINYKRAVILAATNRQSEHDEIINELIELGKDQKTDEVQRWSSLATLRLLSKLAANRETSRMREILQNVTLNQDQLVGIPQTEREIVFQEMGKVGLRFRVVFNTADDIRSLEDRLLVLNQFSEDDVDRRSTLWRLADCYRIAGRIPAARQILEDLVENQWRDEFKSNKFQLPLSKRDKRILTTDLLWLIGAEGEGNDPDAALDRIKIDRPSDPLAIERARLLLILYNRAQGRGADEEASESLKEAKRLLDTWLKQPSPDTTYMESGQAYLLRGLIAQYELERSTENSRTASDSGEYWKRALRRNWRGGALHTTQFDNLLGAEGVLITNELAIDGAAISLFKEISADEVENALKCYIPGSGISSSIGSNVVKRLLAPKGGRFGNLTAQDLLKKVFTDIYDTPQGEQLRERMILRNCSLKEFQHDPIYHILYRVIYLAGFQDKGFPVEVEPIVWEELKALVQLYDKPEPIDKGDSLPGQPRDVQPRLEDEDFEKLLSLFNGNYSQNDWTIIQQKFGKRLSGSAAYVFGNIYINLGQPDRAREFFQFAIMSAETLPVIVAACQVDLQTIETKP